jgi:EAL domain-containing protein (putative c-di-GMP-specific phosphodiesterase class I)
MRADAHRARGVMPMTGYLDVEEALRKREFFLEYLPFVDMDSGLCIGAEALVRWRRPPIVVPPLEFIPMVDNTYLSGPLAYFVMEEISRELLDWLRENDAFISFNVAPEIIGRGGLAYVAGITGLADLRGKIVIEITERGVPDRIGIEALNRAVQLGFRFALDDVGVAGANPIVLARCQVEMVKFDRDLISQVRLGEPLPSGLDAISDLLKTGKMTAVAEGVESAEQVEALKSAGFRIAQGYYFSRPISAEELKIYFER